MNIKEYIENYNIEDFKRKTADIFAKNNIYFADEYKTDIIYNVNDKVYKTFNKYNKEFYSSLKNNNQNHDLSDIGYWIKCRKCITDDVIMDCINSAKNIILSGIFCPHKDNPIMQKAFFYLLGCLVFNTIDPLSVSGIISSESIDSMSISKSYSNFTQQNPIFNNYFGQCFKSLALNIIGRNPDVCSIGVFNNDSYFYPD